MMYLLLFVYFQSERKILIQNEIYYSNKYIMQDYLSRYKKFFCLF